MVWPIVAGIMGALGGGGAAAGGAAAGSMAGASVPLSQAAAAGIMNPAVAGGATTGAAGGWGELMQGMMSGGTGGGETGTGIEPPKLPGAGIGPMGPTQRGPQGAPNIMGLMQQPQMPGPAGNTNPGPRRAGGMGPLQEMDKPNLYSLMSMVNGLPLKKKKEMAKSSRKFNNYLGGLMNG